MSFDLAVWFERSPITDAQAAAIYDLLCDEDAVAGVADNDGVTAFYVDLIGRFPSMGAFSDDEVDQVVWSVDPEFVEGGLVLCVTDSAEGEVVPVVERLADQYTLVCYDAQAGKVRLPGRFANPVMHLDVGGIRAIRNPSRDQIAVAIRELGSRRSYVILERLPEHYLQAGWGKNAGLTGDGYAVEYRAGGPDQHFRYETTSLGIVADIFDKYAQGDDESMCRYSWQSYQL